MGIWDATKNFVLAILMALTISCGIRQPSLSGDPFALQKFDDTTQFPYSASPEDQRRIRDKYGIVQNGMTGEEVLKIMGRPDEVDRLAGAFGPTYGWSWTYSINKQFPRAPDNSDNFVMIFFDKSGLVKKVEVQFDAPPRPTPLPENMKIKIGNVEK